MYENFKFYVSKYKIFYFHITKYRIEFNLITWKIIEIINKIIKNFILPYNIAKIIQKNTRREKRTKYKI